MPSHPACFTAGPMNLEQIIAFSEISFVHRVRCVTLLPQQDLDVPAAPEDMKNQHVVLFNVIDDDIVANGKTARPGRKSSSR
jgi:hypothetical protein